MSCCRPPTAVFRASAAGGDRVGIRPAGQRLEGRDRALILTSLLGGLRADELLRANVGDVRRSDAGAVIHVRGKGGNDRRIPVEPAFVDVLENYLDGRAVRFLTTAKRRSSPEGGLAAWPPTTPLFVGSDGDRITRGTLQYRVLRAFRRASIGGDRARGALVHGLRHTFATELADAGVSVYTLMKLLGQESMVTSQSLSPQQELKPARPQSRTGFTTCSKVGSDYG